MQQVVPYLDESALRELVEGMKWRPVTEDGTPLNKLSDSECDVWLGGNREKVEAAILRAGDVRAQQIKETGRQACYETLAFHVASKLQISISSDSSLDAVEAEIVSALMKKYEESLSPEEREAWLRDFRVEAQRRGISIAPELTGLGVLTAAQLSGFGVYLVASTALGAISSTLGLGLGFGAFVGLSKAISIIIGPVGWAVLIGSFLLKVLFGRSSPEPDYERLVPAIVFIAVQRNSPAVRMRRAAAAEEVEEILALVDETPSAQVAQSVADAAEGIAGGTSTHGLIVLVGRLLRAFGDIASDEEKRQLEDALLNYVRVVGEGESQPILVRLTDNVDRLAPSFLDHWQCQVLKAAPGLRNLCYIRAPEYGETHLRTVTAMGRAILKELTAERELGVV